MTQAIMCNNTACLPCLRCPALPLRLRLTYLPPLPCWRSPSRPAPPGHEAAQLESSLGVHVLRHEDKKPGGGAAEVERHFGCPANQLLMVGDRCDRPGWEERGGAGKGWDRALRWW